MGTSADANNPNNKLDHNKPDIRANNNNKNYYVLNKKKGLNSISLFFKDFPYSLFK